MRIHREGRSFLILFLIVLALVTSLVYSFLPVWVWALVSTVGVIKFLFFLQFFRNPKPNLASGENLIIAPANGKVVVIEKALENEYFKDERLQISIFMSPFDVHVNRNPISGILKYFKYHPGKYLVAWHPKSSTENERTTLVVQKNNGIEVLLRQIAGAVARRIKWYVKEGDSVEQGNEFGFIKFGSRVDLFLPVNTEVKTKIGEKTVAGETVIAKLLS